MNLAGRRAVFRWGMRLFKRDWRQQVLVLVLLSLAVAAALFGSVAISNAIPSPDGEFGHGNLLIRQRADNGPRTATNFNAIREQFGTIEVIGHRAVLIPGSTDSVDFRAQKPDGALGAPMLRLRAGRYPSAPGEIAMTDGAAADFHMRLGGTATFDGAARTMVGIVENPAKLDDEFALGLDADVAAPSVAILARANFDPRNGVQQIRGGATYSIEVRGSNDKPLAAALVLLLSSVLLMLVALVATASFAVIAHRRQRQLGMLASVGATDGQLRLVMLSNGLAVGALAAVVGSAVALALWAALNARLEHVMNHRLSITDVPWWVVGASAALALIAATAAAWWPARAVTRVPVTEALSGRPPQPARAHRSLLAAVVLLTGGCVGLATGVNTVHGDANPWLLIPGALAVVVGVLIISPLAIRALSRVSRRSPLPVRLALRDLNRYSARSGAALAAIALGLGIAVCTVVVATVAKEHFDRGNLPDTQLLFTTRNDFVPPDAVPSFRGAVDTVAADLGSRTHVYELDVLQNQLPPDVARKFEGEPPPPLELARRLSAHSFRFVDRIFVATPELLDHLELHPEPDVDLLTSVTATDVVALTLGREFPKLRIEHYSGTDFRSGPSTLITEAGMRKLGLPRFTNGWLVQADHPLSADEVRVVRTAAADAGMLVESRDKQASLLATRTIATAAGVLLALALLAMTIGLIRSEAGRDAQTLVAAGATSFTRRALTASTSASLAVLGSALGIGGAYLGLAAIYADRISDLSHPPLPELAVLLLGLPLIAGVFAWLLSGREPAVIVRHALD